MMMLILALVCVCVGAELELGEDVRFIDDLLVERPGLSAQLDDDGFLFPVRREGELVGWVGVGAGSWTFPFEADWQSQRFANTLVVADGVDREEVAPAVRERRWTEPVDLLLALSADPELSEVVGRSQPVTRDRDAIGYVDDDGMFVVVVSPLGLARARELARKALGARLRHLAHAGVDIHDALVVDVVDPGPDRVLLDARTARSWRSFVEPADTNLHERWLSAVFDPTGQVQVGLTSQVFVIGVSDDGTATPRWATLASRPGHPTGPTVARHQANVVLATQAGGRSVRAEIEQLLTLTAGEHGAAVVPLVQPYAVHDGMHGLTPAWNGYTALTVHGPDGEPLERIADVFGVVREEGVDSGVWRLPQPLGPGEQVQVRLRHQVEWWTSHQLETKRFVVEALRCRGVPACSDPRCEAICAKAPEAVQLGHVASARPVVARMPGQLAHPVSLRVGTTLKLPWNVAVTGGRTELREVGEGRWWLAETDSRARVTVAQDRGESTSPVGGMPGLHVLGAGQPQPGQTVWMRSLLNFYGRVFPGMPVAELDLVRAAERPVVIDPVRPFAPDPPTVEAHHGQIVVRGLREIVHPPQDQSMTTQDVLAMQSEDGGAAWQRQFMNRGMRPTSVERWLDNSLPHHVERELAGAVAAQWFLERDLLPRDRWMAEVVPDWLRERFSDEAWGEEVAAHHLVHANTELKEILSGVPAVPLSADEAWTAHLGSGWMRGLQARIGEADLNRALARVLEGEARTTDALSAALAEARTDASHWVDAWVHGGVRPTVRAEWWLDGDEQLQVVVETDVPFGRMDVPLSLMDRKGERIVWVTVDEGRGVVREPLRRPVQRVRVDPEGWLPLRSATAVRRQTTASGTALPVGEEEDRLL